MYQFKLNPITRQLNLVKDAIDLGSAFQGVYDNATSYVLSDVVAKDGKLYVCLQTGTNHDPSSSPTYWDELDLQGPMGPSGADGGAWFHVSGTSDPNNT
ncbi:MAG: hypothetical protein H7839_12865, partial [Magnetococcus sp. YQC-5]